MSVHSGAVASAELSKPRSTYIKPQSISVLLMIAAAVLTVWFSKVGPLPRIARALIAAAVLSPLRRASIVLQTQYSDPRIASGALPQCYSIWQSIQTLWRDQGFLSLWRGLPALLAATAALEIASMVQERLATPLLDASEFEGGLAFGGLGGSDSGADKWGKLLRGSAVQLAVALGGQVLAYPFVVVHTILSSGAVAVAPECSCVE